MYMYIYMYMFRVQAKVKQKPVRVQSTLTPSFDVNRTKVSITPQ